MASIEAQILIHSPRHKNSQVNADRPTVGEAESSVTFDSEGYAHVSTLQDQTFQDYLTGLVGATIIDTTWIKETLTPGTVQVATTLRGLSMTATGATTLVLRDGSAEGEIVFGPLTIVNTLTRLIVFGSGKTFTNGVYVDVTGGAVAGYLL